MVEFEVQMDEPVRETLEKLIVLLNSEYIDLVALNQITSLGLVDIQAQYLNYIIFSLLILLLLSLLNVYLNTHFYLYRYYLFTIIY